MTVAAPDRDRRGRASPVWRLADRIASVMALAGGAILVLLAGLVTASVLSRWMMGVEVSGAYEIVQVGTAVAGFLFLPICQLRNGNIIVDAFTGRTPQWLRSCLDGCWAALYALTAAVLAWRLAIGATETIANGTVTTMTRLPFGWAMLTGAAALLILSFVAAVTATRTVRANP